ncbi:MAG TPA: 1,4-dihydroxy-2-naphthoate polyprenyltransferase [Actinobacteria bacterium]|nr:1,4-dihydroxy-2-naphthoate polyprenyltransferase [Actinomycetota bacterium]
MLAARPATLPAAAAPVLVGGGLAAHDGVFRWDLFAVTLFAALALQVGVNFANDLSDGLRGVDDDRVGPVRAVAAGLIAPDAMRRGIVVVFGLAVAAGLYLALHAGWVIVGIGVASILAALGYTGGPIPYGYRGLGEASVFVFFGLVATVGTRYVFDRTAPSGVWLLGASMGAFAAAILVANNLRDRAGDEAAGKRTLAVILGDRRTRILFSGLLGGAYAAIAVAVVAGYLPTTTLLGLVTAPGALRLARRTDPSDPSRLVGVLVGTARLQLVTALLVSVGLLVGGR